MRKKRISVSSVSIGCCLIFLYLTSAAQAQSLQGRWGIGIQAGATVLSQHVDQFDTKGDVGPIISGKFLYGFSDTLQTGFNVEWETHGVKSGGSNLGDITTISVMPFAEFHPARFGAFSPYASLGVGINFNSWDVSDTLKAACGGFGCKIDPDRTFALKAGLGADYFIAPDLALNSEAGWKMNSGHKDLKILGPGGSVNSTTESGFKASGVSFLLGLRYYF